MSDMSDGRALLAAAPVSVGVPYEAVSSLAALPCFLPAFPLRRGVPWPE